MKTHIIIHVLPYEIDRFEHQMFELRKNSAYLDKTDEIVIDATLNVNGELTDWGIAEIHKNYFIDRFEKVKQVAEWANPIFDVDSDNKCLGIDDKRRNSIKKYSSACDNFLYLDNDMFYPNTTLKYIMEAAKMIKKKYYIISPQCTWLWDNSWDVLVNDHYKQFSNDLSYDQFEVFTKDYGEISVAVMPVFKMGGGWFNLISSDLLAYVGVPDAFGPYGFDDTFLMDACRIMNQMGVDVQQYLVKNLVVTQSYKFELHNAYKDYIPFCVGRKKQFADNAAAFYNQEIQKFAEQCKADRIQGKI